MAASKVLDEVEDELSCSLCYEQYDSDNRAPKVLPCQHTFCYLCLVQYDGGSFERGLPCPTCKKSVNVDEGGIQALPNNLTIVSLIGRIARMNIAEEGDQLSKPEDRIIKEKESFCKEHSKHGEYICLTCQVVLCSKCIVEIIREKKHVDHTIDELDDAFDHAKQKLKELYPVKITSCVQECERFVTSYGGCFKKMEKTINSTADKAMEDVQAWRTSSLDTVKAAQNKTLSDMNDNLKDLQMQEKEFQSKFAKTNASIENKDIESLTQSAVIIHKVKQLVGKCETFLKEKEFVLQFGKLQASDIKLRQVSIQKMGSDTDLPQMGQTKSAYANSHKQACTRKSCIWCSCYVYVTVGTTCCPNCHNQLA